MAISVRPRYGMQSYGPPSARDNIAEGQAIASAQRAQQTNAAERARTQAMNTGLGQANSLGRMSAYSQFRQGPSPLDAFHKSEQQGPPAAMPGQTPSIGTTLTPAQGDAIFGKATTPAPDPSAGAAHDAGLAVAGKSQTALTPYGTISSTFAKPGDVAQEGPPSVSGTGVTNPGTTPAFDQNAAIASLRANPDMKGIFTANTPENAAFVAHYNQNGLQSALQNAGSIVQGAQKPPATPAPPGEPAPKPYAGAAGGIVGAVAPMTQQGPPAPVPGQQPAIRPPQPASAQPPESGVNAFGVPTTTGVGNGLRATASWLGRINPYGSL